MIKNNSYKVPSITLDRLDKSECNTMIGNTSEDKKVQAFLKGKEITQQFTIRIPVPLYQELRNTAFAQNNKMNQIIIELIRQYISNK